MRSFRAAHISTAAQQSLLAVCCLLAVNNSSEQSLPARVKTNIAWRLHQVSVRMSGSWFSRLCRSVATHDCSAGNIVCRALLLPFPNELTGTRLSLAVGLSSSELLPPNIPGPQVNICGPATRIGRGVRNLRKHSMPHWSHLASCPERFEDLADVVFVVGNERLPAHSQYMASDPKLMQALMRDSPTFSKDQPLLLDQQLQAFAREDVQTF
ncbi:hypothetical protein WJX77_002259 [Trebouxia sp. C0004]